MVLSCMVEKEEFYQVLRYYGYAERMERARLVGKMHMRYGGEETKCKIS